MSVRLHLRARSHADDTAYRTTIDLAAACEHLTWRLVGGVAVHLQQRLHEIDEVPDRATRDADAAIQVAVGHNRSRNQMAADLARLVDTLADRGYHQVAGNRFVRPAQAHADARAIDLLVPGYQSTIQHSQRLPDDRLRVDAVPGLGFALGPQAPVVVELAVDYLDGGHATATVPVASAHALLVVKALAWRGRRATKDAVDIWRLLEIGRVLGLSASDWPAAGAVGDARRVLQAHAQPISNAATSDTRQRARIRALIAVHVTDSPQDADE